MDHSELEPIPESAGLGRNAVGVRERALRPLLQSHAAGRTEVPWTELDKVGKPL